MNAYTVSRLADDAGVSVHVVRDYIVRGLLRPVACTTGGYGLYSWTTQSGCTSAMSGNYMVGLFVSGATNCALNPLSCQFCR